MFTELRTALRPAIILLLLLTAVTGIAYPLALTGLAQLLMPAPANGSLIRAEDGRVIGSELIGQRFVGAGYFHGRPSAAGEGNDASASAATNLAPGSRDLRDAVAARVADARADGLTGDFAPPDLVTTSASGLDPHVSPEAAFAQARRVAAARGMSEAAMRALIAKSIEEPMLGFLGERRVNVLLLNRRLDAGAPGRQPPPAAANDRP